MNTWFKNRRQKLTFSKRLKYSTGKTLSKKGLEVFVFLLVCGLSLGAWMYQKAKTEAGEPQVLGAFQSENKPQEYQVGAKDDIFKIAKEYGVGWEKIAELNHLTPPYTITEKQTLLLPTE